MPAVAKKFELPFWAKPEGLAPDPKRPGFTVAGDPYKGNPKAKTVLVEFADFQCPSCQKHALTSQPEIDKQFVATGQVMWVFKHFPLREHAQRYGVGLTASHAELASAADLVLCAVTASQTVAVAEAIVLYSTAVISVGTCSARYVA